MNIVKLIVSDHSNLYLGCGQILEVSTGKVSRGEMKILKMVFSSTKSRFFSGLTCKPTLSYLYSTGSFRQ